MAIRSGLGAQFGIKKESVYGTEVVVDSFTQMETEGLKLEQGEIKSPFLGTVMLQTSQVSTYTRGASGDIMFPFFNKGMGVLLEQCFGSGVSAQVASTVEYTHTFTPDLTDGKTGLSSTVQVLKPNTEGSLVNPFTAAGGKVVSFEISMDAQGLLKLKTTWAFASGGFATTLATASYATNQSMFNWTQAVITLDGTAFNAKQFSVKCDWGFDLERYFLGSTSRREPILNASPGVSITGSMSGEFDDLTAYNMFVAGSFQPLVVTITGGVIPTLATHYKVTMTLPNVRLTGDTPVVGGPGVVENPAPFEAAQSGATSPFTLVTNSDEATL